jgi:chemotaxis protein CheD
MTRAAVLGKFAHIQKFQAREGHRVVARILPGEYYVTTQDEVITTVLGSCISACICDPEAKIGGMNHFMLPESESGDSRWSNTLADATHRYGNYAMESLINDILKLGGVKSRLQVKIFGGGKILEAMTDIGKRNIDFAREYLLAEQLTIVSQDVGDRFPRKVNYYPESGKVRVKKLRALYNEDIARREKQFISEIKTEPVGGDAELF